MKTAEETLIAWHNPPFGLDAKSKSEITNAMKEFAIEVAKEALNNAHDACLKGSNGGPEAALRSIIKHTNIPKL